MTAFPLRAFRRLLVLGAFVGALAPAAVRAAPPDVVVLRLEVQGGIPRATGDVLTDYLVENLRASRGFSRVSSFRELEQVLTLERQKQILNCDDEGCIAEIAGALGAQLVAMGSLGKVGDAMLLTLRLLNARDGAALSSTATVVCGTADAQLLRAVRYASAVLVRNAGLASDTVASAPPPERCAGTDGAVASGVAAAAPDASSSFPVVRVGALGLGGVAFASLLVGVASLAGAVLWTLAINIPATLQWMLTPGLVGTPRVVALRVPPAALLVLGLGLAVLGVATTLGSVTLLGRS